MKKIYITILMIGLVLQCTLGQTLKKATPEQSKQMIETIEKKSSDVKTVSCNFKQEKKLSLLTDKVISSGKMYFSDGKLRWEYVSPYKYVFVFNKQQIFIKSEDKTQKIDAANNQIFKNITRMMSNGVTGVNLSSNSDFTVEMYTQGDVWVAKLLPKQSKMKKMFSDITIFFNSSRNLASKIVMNEASGDQTVISITNAKINEKVADSLFSQP